MQLRRTLVVLAATASLLVGAAPAGVAAPPAQAVRDVEVATYNLFLGGDIGRLLAPGVDTLPEFLQAAALLWQEVVESDFPARAEAVADLLADEQPDVVGLQEVALWQAAPLDPRVPQPPTYDFLAILLDELAERGTPYRAVATNTNFVSPTIPLPSLGIAVQYADRDVVLVRADARTSQVKVLGTTSQVFDAAVTVPLPAPLPTISILRGWSSVDVKLRGTTYRFVNTHLEAFSPLVREAQAAELAAALSTSPHPVVLVGDLNDDPGEGAVDILTDALGLRDAWATGSGPGLTSGQDIDAPTAEFDRRIDYVLYEPDRRPRISAVRAEVLGEELDDRTADGLWPSDHAGVLAELELRVR